MRIRLIVSTALVLLFAASVEAQPSSEENVTLDIDSVELGQAVQMIIRNRNVSLVTGEDLKEVILEPGRGGVFQVSLDNEVIFDRSVEGRFPESKELKQLIRDRIDPERDLGHSDR